MAKQYHDIHIGDRASIIHELTQQDVERFMDLTGDDNKLHYDAAFAGQTSLRKPVVHGMLGASFISTVIGTKLPGDGALWYSQSIEFHLPVRIGDILTVEAEVVRKHESLQAIELQIEITNQHKQKVTSGLAKVKIVSPEPSPLINTVMPNRKVALVLGGSGGIGRAVCATLAKDGFDVAIHYYKSADVARTLQTKIMALGREAILVSGDMGSESDLAEMVTTVKDRLGNITTLVNCATTKVPQISFDRVNWSDINEHLQVHLRSSFLLCQQVIPAMIENKYGKLIFLSTMFTQVIQPGFLPYAVSKAALEVLVKSFALELAPKGIRVNCVSPGITETDLTADIPEKIRLLVAAKTPLRRLAKPEDVANAVAFLASDRSDYLCGETIHVNGGQYMV